MKKNQSPKMYKKQLTVLYNHLERHQETIYTLPKMLVSYMKSEALQILQILMCSYPENYMSLNQICSNPATSGRPKG